MAREPIRSLAPSADLTWTDALLFVDSADDVATMVVALHSRKLRPVVVMNVDQAVDLIGRWAPNVAIVVDARNDVVPLLSNLEKLSIPTVLVATADAFTKTPRLTTLSTAISLSHDAGEIARTAEIVAAVQSPRSAILSAGALRIDLREGVAFVDDRRVELPRKEFALLVELARHPGELISSDELARRVWPGTPATQQDVHRHVYRLRERLSDHKRIPPLIVNRRGFGYFLDRRRSERQD